MRNILLASLVCDETLFYWKSKTIRPGVQVSAERLKSLREKRWDTIEILALPSLASLSGTCYRGRG